MDFRINTPNDHGWSHASVCDGSQHARERLFDREPPAPLKDRGSEAFDSGALRDIKARRECGPHEATFRIGSKDLDVVKRRHDDKVSKRTDRQLDRRRTPKLEWHVELRVELLNHVRLRKTPRQLTTNVPQDSIELSQLRNDRSINRDYKGIGVRLE